MTYASASLVHTVYISILTKCLRKEINSKECEKCVLSFEKYKVPEESTHTILTWIRLRHIQCFVHCCKTPCFARFRNFFSYKIRFIDVKNISETIWVVHGCIFHGVFGLNQPPPPPPPYLWRLLLSSVKLQIPDQANWYTVQCIVYCFIL